MKPQIVLCMIVKNESATIERCLAAALPRVDAWLIADTGSTDDTPARVATATSGLPGRLLRDEAWTNFGANRTRAAEAARSFALEQGMPLDETYLLWLDAGMRLHVRNELWRSELRAPAYEVLEDDGAVRSLRTRLGRLSHAWTSVGVAHARWVASPPTEPERLDSIWIEDHGAAGPQKHERNSALFREGLAREPENLDYFLGLADSLSDAGRHAEAIPWYEKRFAAGVAETETVWYARYRQGRSHLLAGESELGAAVLLDAFERRPGRAEPLALLARHYRERGENQLAFGLAERALALPYPERDRLRVNPRAYGRDALEEISITAYYLGKKALGLDACERLLADRDPVSVEGSAHTARNELFYLPASVKLECAGAIPISRELRTKAERYFGLAAPSTTEYVPKNPTVARLGDRVLMNVPLVNYWHERGRVFVPHDADGVVRTRSAILEWDPVHERPKSEWESRIELPDGWNQTPRIRGLEDQRWVAHDGRLWLTAMTCHVPGANGEPRVVLGRLFEDQSGVEELVLLHYERARSCEKNWLPWSLDGAMLLVYSYDPFVVLRVDTTTGACTEAVRWTPPWSALRWRGGTPPVPFHGQPDRFLMLVHETVWPEHATVYLHRWVELSAARGATGERELRITRYSRLFSFEHHGVEYACGLLAESDGSLFVTYGSEEREARYAVVDGREVQRMLETGPTRSI